MVTGRISVRVFIADERSTVSDVTSVAEVIRRMSVLIVLMLVAIIFVMCKTKSGSLNTRCKGKGHRVEDCPKKL